ncbi:glycosyl hydrolase family 61-domain-containing protein [Crucibulum laeve]|uniref:lytic cellulose monooxygenase (C4-dehydrogenating) n=1 Tax=Crucibulum laeve TaxID=68775 RepID=A0A5C3LU61_9AGAR|nr:glycosyl hydrolase family 61-domain-containing protein [Crucibulum laeve]
MMSTTFKSLFVLALPLLASAHGIVTKVTIAGKVFNGNTPNQNSPSIIRKSSSPDPNKPASSPALTCGPNAGPAALVADANPGDELQFFWTGADKSNWPHNTGPMLTYLANCGDVTCDKFDTSNAKWFKIDQVGRKSQGSADWVQADLMTGSPATVSLPSNLAPGNYLIRHEIIALHLATSFQGAEFYPACAQLKVGGSGTGAPKQSELVSFPGGYSDNDKGIFDPDVFTPSVAYVFPGPQIASFVSGSSSAPAPSSGSSPSSSKAPSASSTKGASSPSATSASSNSGAPKSCKLKKSSSKSASAAATSATMRPRHVSRVMRGLAFGQSH